MALSFAVVASTAELHLIFKIGEASSCDLPSDTIEIDLRNRIDHVDFRSATGVVEHGINWFQFTTASFGLDINSSDLDYV